MIPTKIIAEKREVEALKNLQHFGFLTTKSIAELTDGASGETALKSAKRVIKRLLEKKLILKRKSVEGINCYVLTMKGATRAKPYTLLNVAKSGVELETRYAKRQELIVTTLIEIKTKFNGILLGEIYLKRDIKKFFVGMHGQVWSPDKKQGIGVYFIPSLKNEIAMHVIQLELKTKQYIKEIHLISFEPTIPMIMNKKIKAIKNTMPARPVDL